MPALAPKAKDIESNISADFLFESKFVRVHDSSMHYVDVGEGPTVLLVHGNPTSSYLWRNVIPLLQDNHRVIALDLIGMGKSDKPDLDYRLADHIRYFEGFVEALDLKNITLVLHDWGGGIGMDYAANHADNIQGIVLMEAVLKPAKWEDADFATRFLFRQFRDPEKGFKINAERNYFVESLLPMMSGRQLSESEKAAYGAPYPTTESRKPVAQWPMEIPLDDGPADNIQRVAKNYDWLVGATQTPVLIVSATPGLIFTEELLRDVRSEIPRAIEVNVGSGLHYIQEVQPTKIGQAINDWSLSLDR